jgi:hypothetical protein
MFVQSLAVHGISISQKIYDAISLNTILKRRDTNVPLATVEREDTDSVGPSVVQIF